MPPEPSHNSLKVKMLVHGRIGESLDYIFEIEPFYDLTVYLLSKLLYSKRG